MSKDTIYRQEAIEAADRADYTGLAVEDVKKVTDEVVKEIKKLPSAQPEIKTDGDTISRQEAIEAVEILLEQTEEDADVKTWNNAIRGAINSIKHHVPPAQPTLYGYNIEHLKLIAEVLREENLPPERVVEAITDIGRIASIISAEFEEELKKVAIRTAGAEEGAMGKTWYWS